MNNNSVPNSASQNYIQASLVYQNPQQSMELDQTKLLIKSESHISFYISNNNSNTSNNSIAKLVNKKDNFYLCLPSKTVEHSSRQLSRQNM